MSAGEFSVCQFFEDDSYEYVRRYVDAQEAVEAARHYTDNVAVQMGITKRVIITDGTDAVVFEWKAGEGVVWPTAEARAEHARLEASTCQVCKGDGESGTYYDDGSPRPCGTCKGTGAAPAKPGEPK